MARFRPRFAVPLFLTVVTAGTSEAQVQVELGPILGYYRPVGSFQSTSATAVTSVRGFSPHALAWARPMCPAPTMPIR